MCLSWLTWPQPCPAQRSGATSSASSTPNSPVSHPCSLSLAVIFRDLTNLDLSCIACRGSGYQVAVGPSRPSRSQEISHMVLVGVSAHWHLLPADGLPQAESCSVVTDCWSFKLTMVCAGGMSGALVPPEGEVCAAVVATPFRTLGDDVTSNATCTALYINPPHQKHVARPLEGQGFEVRPSLSYRYHYYTLFVPKEARCVCMQAADKGYQKPTPLWARQIQARPKSSMARLRIYILLPASRGPLFWALSESEH